MPWVPSKDQPKSGWQPAEKPISTLEDIKNAVQGGLVRGWRGAADSVKQATTPANPLEMIGQAADTVDALSSLFRAKDGKPPLPRSTIPAPPQAQPGHVNPAYKAKTTVGRYAGSIAEMSPALVAPGSAPARIANTVLPGIGAQGAEDVARDLGANDQVAGYARAAGGLLGGLVANTRVNGPPPGTPRRDPVLERVARGQDPARLQTEAARYRDANIRPSLIDVVDDSARGTVRAAASRQTPARQAATEFRDARALDLPSRVGGQARRIMSPDPRTPDQIRTEMAANRASNANEAFGAVRNDMIPLADETVTGLRSDYGRRAIVEAASRERDPEVRAALNRLAGDALDNPGGTQITIGMADRISRVLNSQAEAAFANQDRDLGGLLHGLAESIRGPARVASPGYASALEGYGTDSRLLGAADVGENLLTRNTDEFVDAAGGLNGDERALALAAGRRAIERKVGENPSSAPGIARQIADAPEQQQRNAALLGQHAPRLQDAMRLEEMRVRNANDIAPRIGSQTQLRSQDASALADGINTAQRGLRAAHGDPAAAIGLFTDWLRSRGMNDRDAQRLVETAISDDPAQLDSLVDYMTRRAAADATPRIRIQVPPALRAENP